MSKIGIQVALVAIVGLFAVSADAVIFDGAGANAPVVLFSAEDYDASTGITPNIGTGGASYNTFDPTGGAQPWGSVADKPAKLANAFGSLAGIDFSAMATGLGDLLAYDPTGLPTGDVSITMFVVVNNFGTPNGSRGGMFGYGDGISENATDDAYFWRRSDGEGNQLGLRTDGGSIDMADALEGGKVTVMAITIVGGTDVKLALKDDDTDATGAGVLPSVWSLDALHGSLGSAYDRPAGTHEAFYFMTGQIGAAAIIASAIDDTLRDQIVDDLYARYGSAQSGEALIPEPATMALLGIGGLMVLRRRRSA